MVWMAIPSKTMEGDKRIELVNLNRVKKILIRRFEDTETYDPSVILLIDKEPIGRIEVHKGYENIAVQNILSVMRNNRQDKVIGIDKMGEILSFDEVFDQLDKEEGKQ